MRKVRIPPLWSPEFAGAEDKEGKYGIYSAFAIKKLLQYERSRADREGSFFSAVFFPLEGLKNGARDIVRILKRFTRLIDHLGWHDQHTVCVLLPHTDIAHAEQFACKIRENYRAKYSLDHEPSISYELFQYPESGEQGGEEEIAASEEAPGERGKKQITGMKSKADSPHERRVSFLFDHKLVSRTQLYFSGWRI